MENKKIIFFGTPAFSVPFLSKLIEDGYDIAAVITAEDKKVGRRHVLTPSPIKKMAQTHAIKVFTPVLIKKNPDFIGVIAQLGASLGIVIAYGKIIPQELIDIFPLGIVNVHPSKLPMYRGPSPMQYALLNGDTETAIDIMQIDAGMDTGDVLFEKVVQIESSEDYEMLQKRISIEGAQFLAQKIPDILSGNINPIPQDNSLATYSKMISRDDALFEGSSSRVDDIVNKGRAYFPWPGLYFMHVAKRIKITHPRAIKNTDAATAGSLFLTKNAECAIMCADGYIVPVTLQLEGKKELTNLEFVQSNSHIFHEKE